MTIPVSTLDLQFGLGNLSTMAEAVIARLLETGRLDATNPHIVAAYQELAFTRLGITAHAFYTATYYSPTLGATLSPLERADFAGDFALLNERVEAIFA